MEKIKLAAVRIRHQYNENYIIFTGKNHAEVIWTITRLNPTLCGHVSQDMQGFVTNTGRFVDREEAAKIAFEAGQIPKEKYKLFSEDLYPQKNRLLKTIFTMLENGISRCDELLSEINAEEFSHACAFTNGMKKGYDTIKEELLKKLECDNFGCDPIDQPCPECKEGRNS